MRRELYDMILWWMEKGAGGFRLDVIDQIAKEPDLKITNNGPKLHEFLRELSRETFQKGDMITVGEAGEQHRKLPRNIAIRMAVNFPWFSSLSTLCLIRKKEKKNGIRFH